MRLAFAALALVLAVGVAHSAPQVNTWEVAPQVVWSDTLGQVATDTVFTDSVVVFGARAVFLMVRSTNPALVPDSISVPIIQTKLPNGAWTYAGGAVSVPPATFTVTAPLTIATAITNQRFAWGIYNEFSSAGTPVPFTNEKFRWRVRAVTVHGNNAAGHVPTGPVIITAYVLK